jgi:hypothetical protein
VRSLITRGEWRWLIIASVFVLSLSSIPYIAGYLSQTPEQVYSGVVFSRMDYNVHLASIHAGLRGEWAYPLLHTSERTTPSYVKMTFILVGQIGRVLPFSAPALFEITRWVFGLWMLITFYIFAARFLESLALRRSAFLLLALGSGVGWLMFALKWQPEAEVSPIDFWLIDLYGFFSLLALPHICAVSALMWSAALTYLDFQKSGAWRHLLLTVMIVVIMQAMQPFAPLVVDVVLAAYVSLQGWRARRIKLRDVIGLCVVAASQLPLLIYATRIFYFDPIWRGHTLLYITPSPSPLYYALGLGALGVYAILGMWRVARRRFAEAHLLLIWILVVIVLIYLPTNFQRRFTEGVMGPIAALGAMGLGCTVLPSLRKVKPWFLNYPFRRARNLVLILALLFAMPSTFYLVSGGTVLMTIRDPKIFDRAEVVAGIKWLGANSKPDDVALSSERVGGVIPMWIGHRVYLGHPIETVNYPVKLEAVKKFYSTMSDDERKTLLAQCDCRFVFYSPHERELGSFNPDAANYLNRVFASGTTVVYEVTR